eukprot:GHVU01102298.1.p1 GENE.GHVU01102298.1~~GHVU01102298.1.p1  ORF type:complete len:141 (-),score=8.73 GHVU01102298.1:60-482(-)
MQHPARAAFIGAVSCFGCDSVFHFGAIVLAAATAEGDITLYYMKNGTPFEQKPFNRGILRDRDALRNYVIDNFEGDKTSTQNIFWLDPTVNEWVELTKSEFKVDEGSIELVVLSSLYPLGKPNQDRTGEDVVHRCVMLLV